MKKNKTYKNPQNLSWNFSCIGPHGSRDRRENPGRPAAPEHDEQLKVQIKMGDSVCTVLLLSSNNLICIVRDANHTTRGLAKRLPISSFQISSISSNLPKDLVEHQSLFHFIQNTLWPLNLSSRIQKFWLHWLAYSFHFWATLRNRKPDGRIKTCVVAHRILRLFRGKTMSANLPRQKGCGGSNDRPTTEYRLQHNYFITADASQLMHLFSCMSRNMRDLGWGTCVT